MEFATMGTVMGYTYVTRSGRALGVGMWITWVGGCLFSFVGAGWSFAISAAVGIAAAPAWYATLVAADIAKMAHCRRHEAHASGDTR